MTTHQDQLLSEATRAAFRDAMASFPSGVTIVTTTDDSGERWGFTASSFCSLSMDPPLVLVCLARSATCFDAFMASTGWVVNIIGPPAHDLAMTFATRGADKFAGDGFGVGRSGHPVVRDAVASLECTAWEKYDGGDHVILVGRVTDVVTTDVPPSVYFRRAFHILEA